MTVKTKIAFGCYLVVAISAMVMGLLYTTSPTIMPYHQQAIGMRWDDIDPNLSLLLLALLRGAGIAGWITGLSIGVLLFIPFRRGEMWSRWAITLLGFVSLLPALYYTVRLKLSTGASTPWIPSIFLLLLLIFGFFLSKDLGKPANK